MVDDGEGEVFGHAEEDGGAEDCLGALGGERGGGRAVRGRKGGEMGGGKGGRMGKGQRWGRGGAFIFNFFDFCFKYVVEIKNRSKRF